MKQQATGSCLAASFRHHVRRSLFAKSVTGVDLTDAFADDVRQSDLFTQLPADVSEAFNCYDRTLMTLLEKYTPMETKRVRTRSSASWYDSDC